MIQQNKAVLEPKFKNERKIGDNPVVRKAFKLIENSQAYYIGIIPTLHKDVIEFYNEHKDNLIDFKNEDDLRLHFLSWEVIHRFCKEKELKKVLKIFKYNKGQIYKQT